MHHMLRQSEAQIMKREVYGISLHGHSSPQFIPYNLDHLIGEGSTSQRVILGANAIVLERVLAIYDGELFVHSLYRTLSLELYISIMKQCCHIPIHISSLDLAWRVATLANNGFLCTCMIETNGSESISCPCILSDAIATNFLPEEFECLLGNMPFQITMYNLLIDKLVYSNYTFVPLISWHNLQYMLYELHAQYYHELLLDQVVQGHCVSLDEARFALFELHSIALVQSLPPLRYYLQRNGQNQLQFGAFFGQLFGNCELEILCSSCEAKERSFSCSFECSQDNDTWFLIWRPK